MAIPLSKFEEIAKLVVDRLAAQERLARYARANAFSVFIAEDGTASEPVPDALLERFRNELVAHATAELAAVDDALRAVGIEPGA
jgi:hypothetical protein